MKTKYSNRAKRKKNEIKLLFNLFFFTAITEVLAEYFQYIDFVYVLKPLLVPILTFIYWKKSRTRDFAYIVAMFFVLLANIFFISTDINSLIIGSLFYLFYRVLIIHLVIKHLKLTHYLPICLGSLPFLAIFGYVAFIAKENMGVGFYVYMLQTILMSFLAGYSLAAYMIDANKKNYWLLIGNILFSVVHLMVVFKIYFLDMLIFQPIAMICYVMAQYFIYKFIILSEKLKN
ncbi:MAG: lysoplasmalogenase family protein [Limnohabitans sp.]|nr:lysoplasmalogenase family protein [Limnohabitans sp.]